MLQHNVHKYSILNKFKNQVVIPFFRFVLTSINDSEHSVIVILHNSRNLKQIKISSKPAANTSALKSTNTYILTSTLFTPIIFPLYTFL